MQSIALSLVVGAGAVLGVSALIVVLAGRSNRVALGVGSGGALLAALVGLPGAITALVSGASTDVALPWSLPVGSLRLGLDPLSAFFLVAVFVVFGLTALYGIGYLAGYHDERRLAPVTAGFNVLFASLLLVVLARDGVTLLLGWEAMSVSSYFLVTFESERDSVRRAGTTFLIATHIGALALVALFALLARHAGGFAFAELARGGQTAFAGANLCFVLALLGFGAKAGFWPLHFWLPDAHPVAPSHVSAVLSGVMIKMGIYGFCRVLAFLGPPPLWWGALMVIVGAISGLAGVVHALAQHDLKRMLAYCSVENVGIIGLGLGLGLLGRHYGVALVAALGYAGALLHVLNHGLSKSLLFQGAGSVIHATGTGRMDRLGGLARRMPATSLAFLVGAVAICGLPPLSGFVSEYMIFLGAFGNGGLPAHAVGLVLTALAALALMGGLAAGCFVRGVGVVFLGEPRSDNARHAHEPALAMRAAMMTLALACVALGFAPVVGVGLVARAAATLAGAVGLPSLGSLPALSGLAVVLSLLVAGLALLRARLLKSRSVAHGPTWGCGYAQPTSRMQYTAAAFAEPILGPFALALQVRTQAQLPEGYFPRAAHFERNVGDTAGERVLVPAWRRFLHLALRFKVIQHGRTQIYLVYMLVTLVALLLWQMGGGPGGRRGAVAHH